MKNFGFTPVGHDDRSLAIAASSTRRWISGLTFLVFGLFGLLLLLAASEQASASDFILTVAPDNLTVNEHVGGVSEANLVLTFTVPPGQTLVGGGMPDDLYQSGRCIVVKRHLDYLVESVIRPSAQEA